MPTTPTLAGLERRASSSARYTVDLEASKSGDRMADSPLSGSRETGAESSIRLPPPEAEASLDWTKRLDVTEGFAREA
ncbi:MAG: hypothetical protein DLM67_16350 [Candidatus Nephthysia bennettiae]|nr:MAG: hypothetical protein DLM67_16350 [Candidatus Dormibacteraeota bacterium]